MGSKFRALNIYFKMTEMSLNHFKHKDVIVLLSTEQKKLYVSTVYIASNMFKIMGILFIKVYLYKSILNSMK